MNNRCHADADLGALVDLPSGHPDLEHTEVCPECRVRLATYRRFLSGCADQADPQREEALSQFLDDHLGTRTAADVVASDNIVGFRRSPLRRVWAPALAVAAVLLIMVSYRQYNQSLPLTSPELMPGIGQVRGDSEAAALTGLNLAVRRDQDGQLVLEWNASTDAEAFRVVIYDAGLHALGRLEAGRKLELVVRPDGIPGGESAVYWSVEVIVDGQVTATSAPAALMIP